MGRVDMAPAATVGAMRKLIVQQWVTVDNIAAEEDGGLSFVSGEPFSETDTSAFKASVMGFIDSVDTMILGANTYAQSKDYWPYADEQGEYGEKLNNLTKFVASSTLDEAPWGDFPAATSKHLKLIEATAFGNGLALLRYGISK